MSASPVPADYAGPLHAAGRSHATPTTTIISELWPLRFDRDLDALGALGPGWNTLGSAPPSAEAIREAKDALRKLVELGCDPIRVVASADEGVAFIFERLADYADLEFTNAGGITATIKRDGVLRVWELEPAGMEEAIREIRDAMR